MNIGLVAWVSNPASMNLRNSLFEAVPFMAHDRWYDCETHKAAIGEHSCELVDFTGDMLHAEGFDNFDKDLIIFLCSHTSKAAIPTLSAHAPGNWGTAELGGADRELCIAPASVLKAFLRSLQKAAHPPYEVLQEVTHHGPLLKKTPCMFVEIGSTEKEWTDKAAGQAVVKALIETLSHPIKEYPTAIGIGGLHTCENFKKTIAGEEYALGHACAKYQLPYLDDLMLNQAIERTYPKAKHILIAWKGLGEHKEKVKRLVESPGLPFSRV